MMTKPPIQKILKGILYTEDKNKHNHEMSRSIKPHEKNKHSESSIESAAYTQILEQEKQLNGRNHHIPINTNSECYGLNSTIKRHCLQTGLKRKI
jgi:hypothetical protein